MLEVGMVVGVLALVLGVGAVLVPMLFRRVTETNEVHIVQTRNKTVSYGKDTGNGNTYYEIPSWVPIFGITKTVLPVSVFDLQLKSYEAYDKGRLPFLVDITAFFRITESNKAAEAVSDFDELKEQLESIVKGSVRTVLAAHDIETIMQDRAVFGESFTKEVTDQLANWGVSAVKNIELMDIRDGSNNNVIANIMEKKKSQIEMESRKEVAENKRKAQEAEIEANRSVQVQQQEANQAVGLKTIEAKQNVALSEQEMQQRIKEKQKETKEKEMAVLQVEHVRTAEINKSTSVIKAQQEQQTAIIAAEANLEVQKKRAEADLEVQKKSAEGQLVLKLKEAEGIAAEGKSRAEAEKAMQLAPVEAQIVLAKEIGENQSYQQYLVTVRQIEANQAVGLEQAKALSNAQIKVVANTGEGSGLGAQIGGLLENLSVGDTASALIGKVVSKD